MIDVRLLAATAALAVAPLAGGLAAGAAPATPSADAPGETLAAPESADAQVALRPIRTAARSLAARTAELPLEQRYAPVSVTRPALRIDVADAAPDLDAVRAVTGVRHATDITVGTLTVHSGGDAHEVEVAAIAPREFRPLVPQVTADAAALWERLDSGEAAFTHERGQELDLELGGYVATGTDADRRLRVGAFASNGTPPVADAIVARSVARRLAIEQRTTHVLVAVEEGTSPDDVAGRLREAVGGEISVIPDPRQPQPVSASQRAGAATIWDALALCESSGDWHINTGNGYYGGLQFLPESWWMVGGTGLPHQASREEQIHRAELLLEIQGWGAWPACSERLGLR